MYTSRSTSKERNNVIHELEYNVVVNESYYYVRAANGNKPVVVAEY